MAINRFMKPWKRDLTADYYTPNFEAWAKLLDKKDTDMEETLAGADKLSSLIPEAGLRLRDDRNAYMQEINAQKEAITNALYESGNTSEARRRIRGLSSDILSSPRLPMYNIDKTFMPEAMKLTMSQTSKSDIYGTPEDEWYDPQTGQVKQTTYDRYDPASAYAYTKTQDTHKYFFDAGEPIKSAFSQFKSVGEELVVKSFYNEETGKTENRYFIGGESGTKDYIDIEHLMKFLDPDGKYGDYAKELYRNAQGDERAYWDAKYRGLSEKDKERKFYEDLLAANYSRIFDKTTNESFIQSAGAGAKGKSPDDESITPAVVAGTTSVGMVYENLESAGQILQSAQNINTQITSLNYSLVTKANEKLSQKFDGKEVIVRESKTGSFKINPEVEQNLTPEQSNALYGEKLDSLGTTVSDFIHKSNDNLLSLNQQKEVYDEILIEAGLTDATSRRILNDLYTQAVNEETEKARYKARGVASENKLSTEKANEKIKSAKASQKDINDRFNKLLEESKHKDLAKLNERIETRKSQVYASDVNVYFPLTANTKDENWVDGMTDGIRQIMGNNNLEIKIPGTDTYLSGKQRDVVNEVLNMHFSGDREDFFKRYSTSFQMFFDKEESRYKLLVNVNNSQISKELGKEGIVQLEVPFGNTFIASNGQKISIPEYMGIESDEEILGTLSQVEKDFNDRGLYTSFQNGRNGEKYMIKADVITSDPNSSEITNDFRVTFDDGKKWGWKIADPREGAVLKKLIGEISQMPKNVQGATETALGLINLYRDQLPSFANQDQKELEKAVNVWLGKGVGNLKSTSDFYTIASGENIENIDKTLQKGFESIAGRIWGATGAKVKVNDVHNPDRNNPNSMHLTGEAIDISWSSEKDREQILNSFKDLLVDDVDFVPSKRYYRLKPEYGGLKVLYETKETNPNATGEHIHISK